MPRADLVYHTDDGEVLELHLHDCNLHIKNSLRVLKPYAEAIGEGEWEHLESTGPCYVELSGIFSKLRT